MYTIKINTFKSEEKSDGKNQYIRSILKDTYYVEGSQIKVNSFDVPDFEKYKSVELFMDIVAKLLKEYQFDSSWYINPTEDRSNFVVISYWNNEKDYKSLVVFHHTHVYILQNGKTIDKIYV